jgi:hypothetical protein
MMKQTDKIELAIIHTNIVGHLALAIGFEGSFFLTDREERQHIGCKRRLLAELLLGCQDPWEQRQFLAFTEGFCLKLSINNNVAQAGLFSCKEKETY